MWKCLLTVAVWAEALSLFESNVHFRGPTPQVLVHGDPGYDIDKVGGLTCLKRVTKPNDGCMAACTEASRGPSECIDDHCVCKPGYCADGVGRCVASSHQRGQWAGTFSIEFQHPYNESMRYLTVNKNKRRPTTPHNAEHGRFNFDAVEATSDSTPEWKLAYSPDGFVRMESVTFPGFALVYHEGPSEEATGEMIAMPSLLHLERAAPEDVTFEVHKLSSGSLEIFHPVTGQIIQSGDPSSPCTRQEGSGWHSSAHGCRSYRGAQEGLDACTKRGPDPAYEDDCRQREQVVFEPHLPGEAIAHVRHHTYNPVPGVTAAHYLWYATIFLVVTGVVLLCCFWSSLLECCGLKD
mmetsp:Transcript_52840/g.115957  ORF Transcript_52840/g.115957 Transcript_52840/m.115957 type:complete len:351 (+) Transcript_52840:110-1162(+)